MRLAGAAVRDEGTDGTSSGGVQRIHQASRRVEGGGGRGVAACAGIGDEGSRSAGVSAGADAKAIEIEGAGAGQREGGPAVESGGAAHCQSAGIDGGSAGMGADTAEGHVAGSVLGQAERAHPTILEGAAEGRIGGVSERERCSSGSVVVLHRAISSEGENGVTEAVEAQDPGAADRHGGVGAEGVRRSALQDGQIGHGGGSAVSRGASGGRESDEVADGKRICARAGDGSADREGRTIGTRAIRTPRLGRAEHNGGGDGDCAGIGSDVDADEGRTRRDGEDAGQKRRCQPGRDGDCRHADRAAAEEDIVDGEIIVQGGGDRRAGGIRVTEVYRVEGSGIGLSIGRSG